MDVMDDKSPDDVCHDLDEPEEPAGVETQNQHIAQVFNTPLLLEMILDYGLRLNECQHLDSEDLLDFRKVSKSWKEAVSKVLKKNEEPLYRITLTKDNSLNGAPEVENNGKKLDNFVRFLATMKPDQGSVYLGFALTVKEEFFRQENYDSLLTCLRQAEHLVELNLKIPWNGGSLPGWFPNSIGRLPALRRLTLVLTTNDLDDLPESETSNLSTDNRAFLLQFLLTKSSKLKVLVIKGHIPSSFQFMELPTSLTSLTWECYCGTMELLHCLIKNHLPELKRLRMLHLFHERPSLAEELLNQMLLKFSKTLHTLELEETFAYEPPRTPVTLRFPVMENLQKLKIWSMHFELETETSSLLTRFPKLNALTLFCHTEGMLKKWTMGAEKAPLVTTFRLELSDEQKDETSNMVPISPDVIISVHSTFANITELLFSQAGRQFSGLQCVFREMRQLKRLIINFRRSEQDVTSDHLDAALIGVPLDVVVGLAACPQQSANLTEIENAPSIKMLTELTYFQLNDTQRMPSFGPPLISDLAFIYAFSGMAKLRHVKLLGKLTLAREMEDDWMQQGRKLEYVK